MSTISKNNELLKQLIKLLQAHRKIFKQERTFQNCTLLLMAEIMVFSRHTVTQLLMSVGRTKRDWSKWYRIFSQKRFPYDEASKVMFAETLKHVGENEWYVVAGDSTQTRRSSLKMEGAHWLRNPLSPVFHQGIHVAQRWFNGSWLMPAEDGYSRAVPIRWMPAFTEKSKPETVQPRKEWEAAVDFLRWVKAELVTHKRAFQRVLMVADGSYDTVNLWKHCPDGVILCARSAKNRALWELPGPNARKNRKYGDRAPTPASYWRSGQGWQKVDISVRGKERNLQFKVRGPFLRRPVPDRPLFLLIVRGKRTTKSYRIPLPFLVNAVKDDAGQWQLPLPVEQLLFWTWQRWEIEVAHRELKSNFGLGNKQCWNPTAAILSVQWSAWVYSVLLLAGYRTWGLTGSPPVPTRWWTGSRRWSLNTLWRGYRAALWGSHQFTPLDSYPPPTNEVSSWLLPALRNSAFASAKS